MVTLNGIDYTTNTAVFSISKAADLADLPTMTASGTGRHGKVFAPAEPGSLAYITDGTDTTYVLDGDTNTWKERQ